MLDFGYIDTTDKNLIDSLTLYKGGIDFYLFSFDKKLILRNNFFKNIFINSDTYYDSFLY